MADSPEIADAVRSLADAPDFRAVFDASPTPLLLLAADPPRFTMLALNEAHAVAFATTVEALTGYGVFEVFPTDAGPEADEFVANIRTSLERVLETGRPDQMPVKPYAVAAADGRSTEERYWTAVNAPVRDAAGRIVQIVSSVRDVTGEVQERRAEEARALLMREVDHRARNALAVVQSVVRMTDAPTVEAFKADLTARVDTLARVQTSLARRRWEGAELRDILEQEMLALVPPQRFRLTGPPVLLQAEQVQAVSMSLHELATNACKYGALASPAGAVAVSWSKDGDRLTLDWREEGGAPVERPAHTGFGTRLVDRLAHQLGGQVRYHWGAEGLRVELTVPV